MSDRGPDPTERFSNRTSDYAKYRPSYPLALLDDLDRLAWGPGAVVADVGAGTGIFTRLVAPRVTRVHALEPNASMRSQGVSDSRGHANILWGPGTAEATGLADASVDALVCAQAFHWFDPVATAAEWCRVLKPGAAVVLVWNERDEGASPIQAEYELLLERWCPDYALVRHKNLTVATVEAFFAPRAVTTLMHRNDQRFDLEGWKGRLRSASYCPLPDQGGHREVMAGLDALFARYQESDGQILFPYRTKAYGGRLN